MARELIREEFDARAGRISPNGRFLAYSSNQSGRFEVHVAPFDASAGVWKAAASQVSKEGAMGGTYWRQDGREMYFLSGDALMAVDVSTATEFQAATPRLLFRLPSTVNGPATLSNVSDRDGRRFVIVTPAASR